MAAPASSGPVVVRFGVFEADLRAGELRRNGLKLKLQQQPLQVLAMLLEHPGEIVTREELHARLWAADTLVDFDHGLNAAVKRLRDALQDSAENPRFVETLARRGYRFIAPVNGGITNGMPLAAATRNRRFFLRPWFAAGLLSSLTLAVLLWELWLHPARRLETIEGQLTANSSENSGNSAAISPDGKYLAYSDHTDIFLKLISTG